MDNKPIHIHTEPGYIEAKDDAALNMANERRSGVYTKFASGFALEKTAPLTATLKKGIYSHQGHKYICYKETVFPFIAAATGQKKICYLISEYIYKSNNVQEHTLKILQGASSANPVPPALMKKDLFAIEATSTSQEEIYQIEITEGNITKISLVTSQLDGIDVNDVSNLQTQIDKKTDKTWSLDEQTRVNGEIAKKGDVTYINQQDALKVDKIAYDAKMLDLDSKNGAQDTAIATAKSTADTANTNAIVANTNADSRVKQTLYDAKMVLLDAKDKAQDDAIKVVQTANDKNDANMINKVEKKGDIMTGALQLPPSNPSGDYHATHKNYVDVQDSKKVDKTAYDAKIIVLENKDKTQDTTIATKADKTYVDTQDAKQVSKSGDSMTGALQLPSANPTALTQAAHKGYVDAKVEPKSDKTYVDTQDAKQVSKSGDSMNGMLTLPLTAPFNTTHATHKTYVDTEVAKKLTTSATLNWQKIKITSDTGGTIGIPKGTSVAKYFQDNPYMFQHFYANSTDNVGSPGTLRGIIGNTGVPSPTNPIGIFWGLGLDYTGKLYGTHTKGNSTSAVEWQRYLDERDKTQFYKDFQVGQITSPTGALSQTPTASETLMQFFTRLVVGMHTVYIAGTISGAPVGNTGFRGIIHKVSANTADYPYGVLDIILSGANPKASFIGMLYGKDLFTEDFWLRFKMQPDQWRTVFYRANGVTLYAKTPTTLTLTASATKPKRLRIYANGNIVHEFDTSGAGASTLVLPFSEMRNNDTVLSFFQDTPSTITFEPRQTNSFNAVLYKIEAIY